MIILWWLLWLYMIILSYYDYIELYYYYDYCIINTFMNRVFPLVINSRKGGGRVHPVWKFSFELLGVWECENGKRSRIMCWMVWLSLVGTSTWWCGRHEFKLRAVVVLLFCSLVWFTWDFWYIYPRQRYTYRRPISLRNIWKGVGVPDVRSMKSSTDKSVGDVGLSFLVYTGKEKDAKRRKRKRQTRSHQKFCLLLPWVLRFT